MKKRLYILMVMVLALFETACFEDKGNYDYTDFVETEVANVEDTYVKLSFKDTLFISPEVKPAGPQYSYLWTINDAYVSVPTMGNGILKDTIGMERDLVYPVELPNGEYEIRLTVTNDETGYSIIKEITLSAQTEFSLGFYVLKETPEGNTEVDLHTDDELMADLIAKSTGSTMAGKPKSMGLVFDYSCIDPETGEYMIPRALSVCADNDIRIFNLNDWSTIFTHEDMFFGSVPENDVPLYLWPNYYCIGYISEAGVNNNYQSGVSGLYSAGKFGVPMTIDKSCKPSIHMMFSGGTWTAYLFDELNHRFLALDYNANLYAFDELDADGDEADYSPNAVPADYEIVFFGRNSSTGKELGYALFEDAQKQKHLYTLELAMGSRANPVTGVSDIPVSMNMTNATLFANNENDANILYYVADNKIWMYEIADGIESELPINGLGDGEITYLSNRYWTYEDDKENNFNYLAVGVHKDGKYQIYLYNSIGGKPDGAPVRVLEGEGKACKMHFNSPAMDAGNPYVSSDYPCSF